MDDNKDFSLGQQIAELRGMTVSGFSAINQRLDVSNGRLAKHDKIISELAEREQYNAGRSKGIKLSYGIVVGLLGLTIAIIAIFYK